MSTRIRIFVLLIALYHTGYSQPKNSDTRSGAISLRWELVENNYHKQPQFLSAFIIHNQGASPFPGQGWALYFNYILDVKPQSVTSGMRIEHVNGDLFRLFPGPGFAGIAPGDSIRVEFVSGDEALNISDAPSGPYMVWADNPSTGTLPGSYTVTPIRDSIASLYTAEKVYNQNWYTRDIPLENLPRIFPTPVECRVMTGYFQLTSTTTLVSSDTAFLREAYYLSDRLDEIWGKTAVKRNDVSTTGTKLSGRTTSAPRNATAGKVITENAIAGKTTIRLEKRPAGEMPEEAYRLDIDRNGIVIAASSASGAFYGIQSLLDLLPPVSWETRQTALKLPYICVKDAPRFGFRSLMVDIGRHFQTRQELQKLLDLMALYKLNTLHLHFSEDEGWRIAIPSLPELTEVGARRGHTTADGHDRLPVSFGDGPDTDHSYGTGYYTREDFIAILQYANERHIQVIPEIESPGHARAAIRAMDARYERLKRLGRIQEAQQYLLRDTNDRSKYSSAQLWTDNVMCPALPSTYQFLAKVADELIAMYKEAGAPLATVHFGGDEVPAGVWEQSPACKALIQQDPSLSGIDDLWYYYFRKVNEIVSSRGLFLSGWEEVAMRKTRLDGSKQLIPNPDFATGKVRVHVWNNLLGSGSEDLPYRLANAGYQVVLSPVNNNYFDLAYNRSPDEQGYYWGGYTDLDKPFYFIPFDYYKSAREDRKGGPIDASTFFIGKDRLTEYGKSHIAGIQGLIWCENVHGPERLEYMLLPKLLGMAERAWAKDPEWALEKDPATSRQLYDQAWTTFLNTVGKRELPRLEHFAGGFSWRIPAPGLKIRDGKVWANIQLPGLTLRYSVGDAPLTAQSPLYTGPIEEKGRITVKAFDGRGRSGMAATALNP